MYEWFLDQMKNNQFMSGAIGGSISFAVISYFKSWFFMIFNLLKNFFIREITLLSATDLGFYNSFNDYVSTFIKHPKNIKISAHKKIISDTYRTDFSTTTYYRRKNKKILNTHQAGYGSHWFWYNWTTFVRVSIHLDSDNHTESKTETISIYFMGLRPRTERNKFYEDFLKIYKNENQLPSYHKFSDYGDTYKVKEIKKRTLTSVFMNKEDRERVDKAILSINYPDERFEKLGRSKTLGIMLEGPPGTGKTSLIQALATKHKRDIYYLDFSSKMKNISSLVSGASKLPQGSFIVLEDIDCHECTHKRDKDTSKSSDLSAVLRMLDGIDLPDNSIIFATTNNIDILDPAITRAGRFDIRIHMGHADKETAKEMIEYVDSSKSNLLEELEFPISHAELQSKILGR